MKILDRYILKSFVYSYVMSLFVLISLYVVLDLFVNFDEFTESSKPVVEVAHNIADYYIHNVPMYFSQLSGVITAFAACTTLARLQRQNEVTAMLASGRSLFRVATPIVLAGLAMNLLVVLDQEVLLPSVAPKLARTRDDVEGVRAYGIWCVRDGEDRLFSAQYFAPKQQRIRGLYILEENRRGNGPARLGDVITARLARWDPVRHGWDLTDGKPDGYGLRIKAADAVQGGLTAEAPVRRVPIKFYPCELTPDELLARQTAQWVRFLSVRQLNQMAKRPDANLLEIARIKHGRFTLPVDNMILLLLGIPFFMNRVPNNVLTQGAKALAMCAIAFMVSFIGQQLVGAGSVNPALPAWLPIFLFGPVCVFLLDRVKT